MKAYELMAALAELPCDTEILVSGLVTVQEITASELMDNNEKDEPMYEFLQKIQDSEYNGTSKRLYLNLGGEI